MGDDQFGDYVRHALEHTFNVDTRYVGTDPDLQTPLAFAELDPPEDPSIIFYREPRAPDLNIDAADIDADVVRDVPIFWMPASRFADARSATAVTTLLEVRSRRAHTVLDLDWRPHVLGIGGRGRRGDPPDARTLHDRDRQQGRV